MRVCCVYDVPGWAHHRRCLALQKYAPPDIQIDILSRTELSEVVTGNYDVILALTYGRVPKLRAKLTAVDSQSILIAGFNVGWGYRSEWLKPLFDSSDHVLFNNWENWHRHGRLPRTSCICNGVDDEVFRVSRPLAERPAKVIWSGSHYHLKHNDDLKGYQTILMAIEDRLQTAGVEHDWHLVDSHGDARMRTPEEMAQWYNGARVYVCASRMEGTPNPLLEACACGCVPCSTRVGNATELIRPGVNGELVDRTADEIFEGIVRCVRWYDMMARKMLADIQPWAWRFRAGQYYDLFRRLMRERHTEVACAS